VHGIPLPDDLQESQKLPTPLFTPSTKAEQGAHDENISPEQGDVPIPLPPTTYNSPLTPNARYEQRRRSSVKNYTTAFPISL
jgi:SAICAR synthetase